MSGLSLNDDEKGVAWLPRAGMYDAIRSPLAGFTFLSFLLIGGDLLSFKLGGLTIKAVTFPIIISYILGLILNNGQILISRKFTTASLLLVLAGALSLPESVDAPRTAGYVAWLGFTFFVLVPLFYNIGRSNKIRPLITFLFSIYRLSTALLIVETPLRIIIPSLFPDHGFRPHLWFYEPSYAAIYFSSYFAASLYLVTNGQNWARRDMAAAIIALGALTSATAMTGILFSIGLCILFSRYRLRLIAIAAILGTIISCVVIYAFSDSIVFDLLFGFFINSLDDPEDLFRAILGRSGNRVVLLLWGIDTFLRHPLFGIGFGADSTYTSLQDIPASAREFMPPWLYGDIYARPFHNPYIEAAATMGVFGLVAFSLISLFPFISFAVLRRDRRAEAIMVKALLFGFVVMFLTLQFESTFLRFYVWSTFGLALGAADRWRGQPDLQVTS